MLNKPPVLCGDCPEKVKYPLLGGDFVFVVIESDQSIRKFTHHNVLVSTTLPLKRDLYIFCSNSLLGDDCNPSPRAELAEKSLD